jgi:hypothetical protein
VSRQDRHDATAEARSLLAEVHAHLVSGLAQLYRTRADSGERKRVVEDLGMTLADLRLVLHQLRDNDEFADPNATLLVGVAMDALEQLNAFVIDGTE